jgi:hypothetical protein
LHGVLCLDGRPEHPPAVPDELGPMILEAFLELAFDAA